MSVSEYTLRRNKGMDYPHFFNYIDLLVTSVLVIVSVCLTIAAIRALIKNKYGFGSWYRQKPNRKLHMGWGLLIAGLLCSSLSISRYSENLAQLQEYVGNGIRAEGIVSPAHDRQTYFTICYRDLQNRPYHLLYKQHSELDTTKPVCIYYKADNPQDAYVITYHESHFKCLIGLIQGGCWALLVFVACVILWLNRKNGLLSL